MVAVGEPSLVDVMVRLAELGEQIRGFEVRGSERDAALRNEIKGMETGLRTEIKALGGEMSALRTEQVREQDRVRRIETTIAGMPTSEQFQKLEERLDKTATWPALGAVLTLIVSVAALLLTVWLK